MLDEIKKDIEWGKKVGGRPQENLDMEQVNWLIEQAEKLQQYEQNKGKCNRCGITIMYND